MGVPAHLLELEEPERAGDPSFLLQSVFHSRFLAAPDAVRTSSALFDGCLWSKRSYCEARTIQHDCLMLSLICGCRACLLHDCQYGASSRQTDRSRMPSWREQLCGDGLFV